MTINFLNNFFTWKSIEIWIWGRWYNFKKWYNSKKLNKVKYNNKIKIAILGGSQYLTLLISLKLLNLENFDVEVYESDYNQYFQEIMFNDKKLKNLTQILFIYLQILKTSIKIMIYPNLIKWLKMK